MPRPRQLLPGAVVTLLITIGALASGASASTELNGVARSPVQDPTVPLAVVSEDPYTNPGTYHKTQVEPHSAAFGSRIVSIFQTGRSHNWGSSNVGWSVSSDAGATWSDGFLPGTTIHATPPGRWQRVTDAVIDYDAKHDTWLIVGLGTRPCSLKQTCAGGQVFVSRSTDGAQTFDEPILPIHVGRSGQFVDVTWIACDNFPNSPFYGNCYIVWNDDWHGQRLNAYTSSDGGMSWTKGTISPSQHCDVHPIPVVQPNGNVIVPLRWCRNDSEQTITSADGGASYVAAHSNLPYFDGRYPGGFFRHLGGLSIDVDAAGTIYAAWPDCQFRPRGPSGQLCGSHNDIVFSTSRDGRHWTKAFRIPIDPVTSSVDHFLPAIAVDPQTSGASAHIGIVYYFYPEQICGPRTCQPSVGFISSTDGGTTWNVQQLAGPFKNTWFPLTTSGYMVGEYIGISFVDGKAVPTFPVATEGTCELGETSSCNEWISSATIPLPLGT
jgi:hypothetical protein